jgi:hypothetical protein
MKKQTRLRPALLLGCLWLSCLLGCRTDKNQTDKNKPAMRHPETSMKATIQRLHFFPNIPSASGMELLGNQVYVVGDDSPFLYVLDRASLQLVEQIQLFASGDFGSGRIPKLLKPDLECLTLLEMEGVPHLAAFGSGSAPNRARSFTVPIGAGKGPAPQVRQQSLQDLYGAIQADPEVLGGDALNLEAAATTPDQLLLFQRATQAGSNLVLAFDRQEFAAYLFGARKTLPAYQALYFQLPSLEGLASRFSGATVYGDKLFFSASVENTDDPIQDGEVLGSFVGWVDLAALQAGQGPVQAHTALVLGPQGTPYKGKVESLVILDQPQPLTYRALAMTDNDQGQSDLLELELSLAAGQAD